MSLLPDGSEKGLRGYASERGVRRRIGLAPPERQIDRNPPYTSACSTRWTIPTSNRATRSPSTTRWT